MGNTAVAGLGRLAHPAFSAKVFGADERLVTGTIGARSVGHGHSNERQVTSQKKLSAVSYQLPASIRLLFAGC
jgi:hypothetical protein